MATVGSVGILFTQAIFAESGGITFKYQSSRDDVDVFYKNRNAVLEVLGNRHILEVSSTWHTFIEGMGYVRDKDVDKPRNQHFVVLLVPQDEGGDLVGEAPIRRPPNARRDPLDPSHDAVVTSRLDVLDAHEAFLVAVAAQDPKGIAQAFHPDAGFVTNPVPGLSIPYNWQGESGIIDYYTRLFDAFSQVQVQCLNRVCGEWYVYSDQLWTLHDGNSGVQEVRTAEYLPLDNDCKFLGRVAYSVPV